MGLLKTFCEHKSLLLLLSTKKEKTEKRELKFVLKMILDTRSKRSIQSLVFNENLYVSIH